VIDVRRVPLEEKLRFEAGVEGVVVKVRGVAGAPGDLRLRALLLCHVDGVLQCKGARRGGLRVDEGRDDKGG